VSEQISIEPIGISDRGEWEKLARGYKAFYATEHEDAEYDAVWQRLIAGRDLHGFCARADGAAIGIAHYLFHTTAWTGEACYLQDLFTAEEARGRGVAGALVDRVALAARERGATRLYWSTKQDNVRARALYDRIAAFKGFIRYDYPL
jgi:ribosomal protein S18 acetylase RimI-like enzyme